MEAHKNNPLYLIFTDVDGAYDYVWREALFAKLLAAHPEIQDIKVIQNLYSKMRAHIQHGGYKSEAIISLLGVAQGDPLSAALYSFFTSDLPDAISKSAAGVTMFGLLITCMIYMDDIVPVHTPQEVLAVLAALRAYGDTWFTFFNLSKTVTNRSNVHKRARPPQTLAIRREMGRDKTHRKVPLGHLHRRQEVAPALP